MKLDKSYIANNWMKILRIMGYITLVLIAFFKLTTPKTIIPDYIEYGKEVVPSETTGIISGMFEKVFSTLDGISPQFTSLVMLLIFAILAIVTLHMFMDKKADKKKK